MGIGKGKVYYDIYNKVWVFKVGELVWWIVKVVLSS